GAPWSCRVWPSENLQLHSVVLDRHRVGRDRLVGGGGLGATGRQGGQRTGSWALNGTGVGGEGALGGPAVVLRAAVLDRVERAGAVEDADLGSVGPLDQLHLAARELGGGANLDLLLRAFSHVIPTREVGF